MIFLGAPGAGKGTQAVRLAEELAIPHISTGAMLREAVQGGTELGDRVKEVIESGQLVPDAMIIDIIRQRLAAADCQAGFILDGFPRTLEQARALSGLAAESACYNIQGAVFFNLPDDEVLKRLEGRRSAEARADDSEVVQRKRIAIYHQQTAPVVAYYGEQEILLEVDSLGSIEEVYTRLKGVLGSD